MIKSYLFLLYGFSFSLITIGSYAQQVVKMHNSVKIGGIDQWIGAKGEDDSKPLLLFLHGGPGFSSRAYSKKFVKYLKEDFIVAQWDQRETGITAAWGPFDDSLTLEIFHEDTEEVVDYLLKKFSKKKLYLVGFSWGGFLGLHYANDHPELLHAYISVSGLIHGTKSEKQTLALLKEKAKAAKNLEAINELSRIQIPYDSWEALYIQRKWLTYFFDVKGAKRKNPQSLYERWADKWMNLWSAALEVNHFETVPDIRCPMYFFLSKNDFVANNVVAEKYFKQVEAEQEGHRKGCRIVEQSSQAGESEGFVGGKELDIENWIRRSYLLTDKEDQQKRAQKYQQQTGHLRQYGCTIHKTEYCRHVEYAPGNIQSLTGLSPPFTSKVMKG